MAKESLSIPMVLSTKEASSKANSMEKESSFIPMEVNIKPSGFVEK